MTNAYLPSVSSEQGLNSYIKQVNTYKMLSQEEEQMLARRVSEEQDSEAAHVLITSHLRLVVKVAMGMRNYGLSMMDLISEGNIGLMHAVKKFNPDLGHRLSTYAMWWIKAAMQEFVVKSWSLVKIGTTAAQKKLFFNLNKIKNKIRSVHGGSTLSLSKKDVTQVAQELNVSEKDVQEMEQRVGKDISLDTPVDAENDNGSTMIEGLADYSQSHEEALSEDSDLDHKRKIFLEATASLNEREKYIISARNLRDAPETLEDLSQKFGVSRERVRQIEARAMEKIKDYCLSTTKVITQH
ncbi:MAG: RNA polymerase sigma factor RpoH [Alphaproteobacteria bacterium]|nr:RNA polymerase sigma factor RpoH [Alphaproteobacteria bacterium]